MIKATTMNSQITMRVPRLSFSSPNRIVTSNTELQRNPSRTLTSAPTNPQEQSPSKMKVATLGRPVTPPGAIDKPCDPFFMLENTGDLPQRRSTTASPRMIGSNRSARLNNMEGLHTGSSLDASSTLQGSPLRSGAVSATAFQALDSPERDIEVGNSFDTLLILDYGI